MKLSLVVACARNLAIGRENQLPWRLPADLQRFKSLTSGHSVIMGRKTFESIGRPLPNRRNIVITRQKDWRAAGVETVPSLEEALVRCEAESEVFVIGGAEVYRLALSRADRIYLTWVESEVEGDAFFPAWPEGEFVETFREDHSADEKNSIAFSFRVLERR